VRNQTVAKTAILLSLALVLGYVEHLIPLPLPFPGVKIGLSNLVLLFALYQLRPANAWLIMLLKVLLTSLLFSGFSAFFYSLLGGVFSLLVMQLARRFCSEVGTSILGGVFHNLGQLCAAAILFGTASVFYYLPPLFVSGAGFGFLLGVLIRLLLQHLPSSI